jgi:hypothetical protein
LVALCEFLLNFNAAPHGGQRAGKLHEKTVSQRFDFSSLILWKNGAKELPVLLQQPQRQCFVSLRKNGIANHVCEHDRRQLPIILFWTLHASSSPPGVIVGKTASPWHRLLFPISRPAIFPLSFCVGRIQALPFFREILTLPSPQPSDQ